MTARIRRLSGLAVGLFAVLCGAAESGTVFDHQDDGFRAIVLVGGQFLGIDQLRSLFLKYEASAPKALVISAFSNEDDAVLMAGKGHTDVSYSDWENMYYSRRGHDTLQMSELIAIGKNVVIRTADRGRVSRVVLRGVDPTLMEIRGNRCELLKLSFHRLPRPLHADGLNPVVVKLNVRTDSFPTDSDAEEITRVIRKSLGQAAVNVAIRSDTWFIEDESFPPWYPFGRDTAPSSVEEYRSHGEIGCSGDVSGIRCAHLLYYGK